MSSMCVVVIHIFDSKIFQFSISLRLKGYKNHVKIEISFSLAFKLFCQKIPVSRNCLQLRFYFIEKGAKFIVLLARQSNCFTVKIFENEEELL